MCLDWTVLFFFPPRLLHRISSVRTFSFFSFLKGRRRNPKKRLVRSVCACPMLIHHENEAGYVWLKKQIMRNGEREVSTSIKMRQTINALQMFFFSLFILCARRRLLGLAEREQKCNDVRVFYSLECCYAPLRTTRSSSGHDKSSESLFHYASRAIKGHIKANFLPWSNLPERIKLSMPKSLNTS